MNKYNLNKFFSGFVALLLPFSSAWAVIPEPDNLLYGTITLDGSALTAADKHVSIVLEYAGKEIASYTLGDDPTVEDRYLLEVPLDSVLKRNTNVLRTGDSFVIRYQTDGVSLKAADVIVAERGTTIELNLVLNSGDIPVGTDPDAIDSDGDGISDVAEVAAGLNPLDPSDALLDSDGDGINDLDEFLNGTSIMVDDAPPHLIAPSDKIFAATGLFTEVDLGIATAFDALDGILTTATADGDGFYAPGEHTVTWSVADAAGNTMTDTQTIRVNPLVNFYPDQLVAEGSSVTVTVELNGVAARYPVIIPFTVSGTAAGDGVDHTLVDGEIKIDSGLVGSIEFLIVDDAEDGEGIEPVIVTMGKPDNAVAGKQNVFVANISEQNIAPYVVLSADQGAGQTSIIVSGNGAVTVRAMVTDANPGDTHSYDWSQTDNVLVDTDGDTVDASFITDMDSLSEGIYKVSVTVTDASDATGNSDLLLQVLNEMPILSPEVDSDGDGIADDVEGITDTDGDAIPDYLDAIAQSNILPAMLLVNDRYLIETEVGLQLAVGSVALNVGNGDAVVTIDEVIAVYDGVSASDVFDGGIFDFWIRGLAQPGASVKVVLPQLSAIPEDAIYTKFSLPDLVSRQFVEDDNNALFSASGTEGYCPPPGDESYTVGLTAGDWCVMLFLEDGGPNDLDGSANKMIIGPDGVQGPTVAVAVPRKGSGGRFEPLFLLLLIIFAVYANRRRKLDEILR